MKLVSVLAAVALAFACAGQVASKSKVATAELRNPEGATVGFLTLTEGSEGVRIAVSLFNMPPGTHALHIHEAGACEAPEFTSAKGHFNPYGRKHGLKNPDGPHAGDLPNVTVGSDGMAAVVVTAPLVTLGEGKNSLFREGGTAIVIHEGPDDYMSDPAGAAGPRIACGEIRMRRE